jgi:uncharacterized protein (UPF0261 family)
MAVVIVGTLDTKGEEVAYLKQLLESQGLEVLVIDAGVLGAPAFEADIPRQEVFAAAGTSWDDLKRQGDRGKAIEAATRGVVQIVKELWQQGKVDGLLGIGGSAGTTIGTAAMRALPVGVPKVMVSTLASGQTRPYVGVRDIMMLYSVVDLAGLNRISRRVLGNAAQAMVGMARSAAQGQAGGSERPLIAATMFGVTTPCVERARKRLEEAGYEVLVFHATGTGGQAMEGLIRDGLVDGVLDITTTELADELVGGILSAGPDRLTAAGQSGVPQVISLGALDMVNFGPPETVPEKFRNRKFYQHNPSVTLMRTTPEENDRLGWEIAVKASGAKGPTAILVPRGGVSAIDAPGKPFWWPEADEALFQRLRHEVSGRVELLEMDHHINDPEFALAAAEKLLELIQQKKSGRYISPS